MKLLSKKEIKENGAREKANLQEIDRYIARKTKEFNLFKEEKETEKKKILRDFLKFTQDIAGKKALLQGDALTAEKRREIASKSITGFYFEAEDRFSQAKKKEEELVMREKAVNQHIERNKEIDKSLIEREGIVQSKIVNIDGREKALLPKERILDQREGELRIKESTFQTRKEYSEKAMEIAFRDIAVATKANESVRKELEDRRLRYQREELDSKRAIASGMEVLEKAWNELRQKQKKHHGSS